MCVCVRVCGGVWGSSLSCTLCMEYHVRMEVLRKYEVGRVSLCMALGEMLVLVYTIAIVWRPGFVIMSCARYKIEL